MLLEIKKETVESKNKEKEKEKVKKTITTISRPSVEEKEIELFFSFITGTDVGIACIILVFSCLDSIISSEKFLETSSSWSFCCFYKYRNELS